MPRCLGPYASPMDPVANALSELGLGALAEKMGIELVEVSAERVVATMPVEGNTQPYGLLHGGASAVLAESLGSIHAAVTAGPESIVVGLDLNCTHHRGLTEGVVRAESRVLSAGRTIISTEITIVDEANRAVCTSRLTCLVRPVTKV